MEIPNPLHLDLKKLNVGNDESWKRKQLTCNYGGRVCNQQRTVVSAGSKPHHSNVSRRLISETSTSRTPTSAAKMAEPPIGTVFPERSNLCFQLLTWRIQSWTEEPVS